MLFVTNRKVEVRGQEVTFTDRPNPAGIHDLRLVLVEGQQGKWEKHLLPDRPGKSLNATLAHCGLELYPDKPEFTSEAVAYGLLKRAQEQKKQILFFVHGYNTSIETMIQSAATLEKLYEVMVVCFSWPSNARITDYLSDKRDARASAPALERLIQRAATFVAKFNREGQNNLAAEAQKRHPDDPKEQALFFNRALPKVCPIKINLLCHSMGNYVYKNALDSSVSEANPLMFTNVALVAADVNNKGHAEWIDKIQAQGQIYITLNENDFALRASRLKFGDQQLARLGHYRKCLDATTACYVDFTDVANDSHSYFADEVASKNTEVQDFFRAVLNGNDGLPLCSQAAGNLYKIGPGK